MRAGNTSNHCAANLQSMLHHEVDQMNNTVRNGVLLLFLIGLLTLLYLVYTTHHR